MTKQTPLILAVDDEADMLETYQSILGKTFNLQTAASGQAALAIVNKTPPAVILLDIKMPKMNGLETLKQIKTSEPETEVIMVTATNDVPSAVEAMKLGAFDYVAKPFDVKELIVIIGKALEKRELVRENLALKEELKAGHVYCDLIGRSPSMKKLFEAIERVAPSDSTVLIHGESGTGKELVARAIHTKSKRSHKSFVAVNCAAIPENLLESELFGHERGSFTGAMERKLGKFELADGGTLFLDEIGCMPPPMQAKLLRVLENRTIERLGGEKSIPINSRIVSATNIDFDKEIKEGRFRHDLFYRLNVIPLNLPPLRERKDDIPLLINYFLDKFNRQLNKKIKALAPATIRSLTEQDWPGNVRELQNLIERIVVLGEESLPFTVKEGDPTEEKIDNIYVALENYERRLIADALAINGQNRAQTAKQLGLPRSTLNSKLEALGLA